MMTEEEASKAYIAARVDFAKTLADAYRHHGRDPEAFVAGVQYALDKILGESERFYSIPYPNPTLGNVVTLEVLHSLGLYILEKAKHGEPQ